MHSIRQSLLLIVLLLSAAAGLVRADEQTATYRIIGLSAPERQEDFRRTMKAVPEIALIDVHFDQAVATVRYDVDKLVPPGPPKKPTDRSAEKVVLKLNELLRKASSGTFSFAAPSATPEDQLARIDINIGLLDCKGCRYAAYLAVAKIDGVEHATVSSEKQTLSAWIDPAKTNRTALEDALKKEQVPLPVP